MIYSPSSHLRCLWVYFRRICGSILCFHVRQYFMWQVRGYSFVFFLHKRILQKAFI